MSPRRRMSASSPFRPMLRPAPTVAFDCERWVIGFGSYEGNRRRSFVASVLKGIRRFMKIGVIVTGLPASGKTTVARDIAKHLGLEFLDKDDFLEGLYERFGVRSWDDRDWLSRQSDQAFIDVAIRLNSAVLVSHWRSPGDRSESGTPSDWVAQEYKKIVEVCCLCSPKIAHVRFLARNRHPGHLDKKNDPNELAQRMEKWASRFPLGVGTLVEVQTERELDTVSLIDDILGALSSN
ncbi:AAA domain-containing protein [Ruegeria sp. P4]|nr:AAA domain-containing protein [Ruegeria sp. P4]